MGSNAQEPSPTMFGKFKLASSENFENYMKSIGVGLIWRKLGLAATPTTDVSVDANGEWLFHSETTFKTNIVRFKLGEEFKEETIDGRTCMSTLTLEDANTLKHVQNCPGGEVMVSRRIFTEEGMKVVLDGPGPEPVRCTRIYARVKK